MSRKITEQELIQADQLIKFIDNSSSPYHAVETVKADLIESGYIELPLEKEWDIKKGGKYFTSKNGSSLFAFNIGSGDIEKSGFSLIAAHSDSPTFKIKPSPEMIEKSGRILKLNTEVYGGPILNTWMDRPLSIAGRVSVKSDNPLSPTTKLVDLKRPLLIIPNIAIHLNRSVNDGVALNRQKDMLPMVKTVTDQFEKDGYLLSLLADQLDIDPSSILDFDLFLYEVENGSIIGADSEFISSGKLDDLAMVFAGLDALKNSSQSEKTKIMAIFDNEEVGSVTKQGAGSPVLRNILERITFKLGKNIEQHQRAIYNSFMISADMAHAVHPNIPETHDPTNKPSINGGPVIKIHANQKYTSDGDSSAIFESLCREADVPCQRFVNRSDLVGGSTLGNISTGKIDFKTVDIGNPMLAMHSVRELGGVKDNSYIIKLFTTFFNI